MKFNENVFEYLNKLDDDGVEIEFMPLSFENKNQNTKKQFSYNEELDSSIDGDEILYEDAEFSKTPNEADEYRTSTESVLGFELNGNQVQYLATEWPAFYHNAEKYASMKDQILSFMNDEGLVTEDQLAIGKVNFADLDDDIDYEEDNPDALHPAINNFDTNNTGFKPLEVQLWDTPAQTQQFGDVESQNQQMTQTLNPENEMIYDDADVDDDFSLMDPDEINKILSNGMTNSETEQNI